MPDLTDFILEREFIGYGYHTPDPQWPGGAKIAINFLVQYNIGAEKNVAEGDDMFDQYLMEFKMKGQEWCKRVARDDMSESQYEYGPRMGVHRLLRTFKELEIPTTWNIFSRAIEQSPYWAKPIVESGAEISCGGKRFIDYMGVPAEEEDKHLREAIDVVEKVTGVAPTGFFTDRRSNATIKLYAQAMKDKGLPLLYSSDNFSDELPFWTPSPVAGDEGGLLMMPLSYDVSDINFGFANRGYNHPSDYYEVLMDTFECLYNEGVKGEPKMMTIVLHPHLIGRAARMTWFTKFLHHIKATPGVWIARRDDIAKHWASVHPYDASKAFGQTPMVAPAEAYPGPGWAKK